MRRTCTQLQPRRVSHAAKTWCVSAVFGNTDAPSLSTRRGASASGTGAAIETAVKPEVSAEAADRLQEDPQKAIAEAKVLLSQAQADLDAGEYSRAIDGFTAVIATAPTQYTLCMKSLLGRRDALMALGDRDAAGRDNRREFAWGRGVRWPGWYIIGAITFRNEIVRELPRKR